MLRTPSTRTDGSLRVGVAMPREGSRTATVEHVPRRPVPAPRSWLLDDDFATGRLLETAPVEAKSAQEVAARLLAALNADPRPITGIAAESGVARSTVYSILTGQAVPDFSSIARLQVALGVPLWPH
jgi:DNA-binding phage protein